MKKKLSIERFTPTFAKKLLEYNDYVAQRNLSSPKVDYLTNKMRTGDFTFASIAIATTTDGRKHIMNGQHQLNTVVQTGIAQDGVLHEFILEGKEGEPELANIFAQYDTSGSRTGAQVAWAFGAAYKIQSLGKSCVSRCASALAWIEWGDTYHRKSKDERARLLQKARPACKFVGHAAFNGHDADSTHIQRVPVMAAMMRTFEVDAADAEKFWGDVRDGQMLKVNSPQLKIRDWLRRHGVGAVRNSSAAIPGGKACYKEVYDRCLQAWNAYRKGGDTSLRYYADKPSPTPV